MLTLNKCINDFQFLDKTHTSSLKGIAILLVILGHLGFISYAGAYGVGIFLILSGFGLTQSFQRNGTNDFIKKRFNKVLIPYSIVTLLWFIIDRFLFKMTYPIIIILKTIFGVQLISPLDPSMWYISFILLWYIAFYFIFSTPQNKLIKLAMLFIFSAMLYKYRYHFSSASGAGLYVLEFPIGVLLGLYYNKIKNLKLIILNSFILTISVLMFIISWICFSKINQDFNIYLIFALAMSIGIISISGVLISVKHSIISIVVYIMKWLGNISFEIYLLEFMIIMRYFTIFKHIENEWLRLTVFIIVVCILAKLLKFIVDKITYFFGKVVDVFMKSVVKQEYSL